MIMDKKIWDYLWEEWVKPIIVAAILALLIRTFIVQPFKIPSSSMFPTLKPGDRIFVSKFIYGAKIPFTDIRLPKVRNPEAGDIVVFLSPIEKKKFLIKRYIAGSGDNVEIKDGKILVNGEMLQEAPFNKFVYFNRGDYGEEEQIITVPENSFFVMGDNSANSLDSRYWGFVPDEKIVGKAFVIHWPINRMKFFKNGD
jgi:signal peptidase I